MCSAADGELALHMGNGDHPHGTVLARPAGGKDDFIAEKPRRGLTAINFGGAALSNRSDPRVAVADLSSLRFSEDMNQHFQLCSVC